MKPFFLRSFTCAASLAFFISACGGNSSATSAAGKGDACKEQCEELNRCDDSVAIDDCTESCTESQLASKGGQEVITDCIVQQECEAAEGDEVLDCVTDGIESISPSAEGQAFCGAGLDTQAECEDSEVTSADRDQCLGWISLFSDEALTKMNACFEKECSAMGLCLLSELAEIRAELEGNPVGQAITERLAKLGQDLGSSEE